MKILIYDEPITNEDAADLLKEIARQIENGMTSGFHPGWELQSN